MNVPRLHPDTIEAVKQRTDIVEVVSDYVALRKQGKDFVGLCPFHEEKTPSFTVSPGKQMYYCFGCQAGGNAITFLKELGKQSFSDVVLDLAQRYQIPVQTLEPEKRQELQRQLSRREQLYEVLAIAANFFQHALHQPQGNKALAYLKSERYLSDDTIQQFQLGYAPGGWETLYGYLVEQKHYPVELVEQAGLIVARKKGSGYYDRFRDRLIIPIRDIQGRPIGFGGRSFGDEQPKYLNSPETELFDKGRTLFALDKARDAIIKADRAIVVEGYFDAIALHAAGIANTVASLGTALSAAQVRQLLRYSESKQVVLNFDADTAGTQAAERAIAEVADLAYKGDVQLRILNIPEGKDADEFLHAASAERYRELLDAAPLWLDWQIENILRDRNLSQADAYHEAVQGLVKLLGKIAHPNTRTHYIHDCAERLSQGDSRRIPLLIENLIVRVKKENAGNRPRAIDLRAEPPLPEDAERSLLDGAESLLLRIYLHCPDYRKLVTDAIAELEAKDLDFTLSHHRFLWQQIVGLQAESTDDIDMFSRVQDRCLEHPDKFKQVSKLFHADEKPQLDVQRAPLVIRSAIACIERVMCQKRARYYLQLWQQTDSASERQTSEHYQQQYYVERSRIQDLDRQRYTSLDDLVQVSWADEFSS